MDKKYLILFTDFSAEYHFIYHTLKFRDCLVALYNKVGGDDVGISNLKLFSLALKGCETFEECIDMFHRFYTFGKIKVVYVIDDCVYKSEEE